MRTNLTKKEREEMYVGRLIKVGKRYHLRYHKEGDSANAKQQSLKAKTSTEALAKMNRFLADLNSEHPVLSEDTTVADLVQSYIEWQRSRGKKDWEKSEQRWQTHLKSTFERVKATRLTTKMLREYIAKRQGEEIFVLSKLTNGGMKISLTGKFPGDGTLRLEMATLKGAYNLAKEDTASLVIPTFPKLAAGKERNDRLDETKLRQLIEATSKEGLWFQTLILLWSSYAWRRSEAVLRLTVSQVDLDACADGEVVPRGRLNLDTTKNGDDRFVYLTRQLKPLIAACIAGKRPDEQVFTREDGSPIGDFRKRWKRICLSIGAGRMVSVEELKKQGLTLKYPKYVGITIHGLRRTGCRLLRAGIGEAAAMRISGHHDVRVFRRHYDGEDDAVILNATKWLDEKHERQMAVKDSVKLG